MNLKNTVNSNNLINNSKKRSTKCRLIFRCQIPSSNEILQVVSAPVLCTQPLGTPEICKKSLSRCHVNGNEEIFIIGKNFLKDAKVIWKNAIWSKVVEPDKEYLHSVRLFVYFDKIVIVIKPNEFLLSQTHLVCTVPSYDGPDLDTEKIFTVSLSIKSGGKYSDSHAFTFYKTQKGKKLTLINHHY